METVRKNNREIMGMERAEGKKDDGAFMEFFQYGLSVHWMADAFCYVLLLRVRTCNASTKAFSAGKT